MIPHFSIKYFLWSIYINGKIFGWVTRVMDYDIDIKITKIVRVKGLCEKLVSTFESPIEAYLVF
jgi:hypothetical protein